MLCPKGARTSFKVMGGQSCALVLAVPPRAPADAWSWELRAVMGREGSYTVQRASGVATTAGEPTRRVVAVVTVPGAIGFELVVDVSRATCPKSIEANLYVSDVPATAPYVGPWT